MDYLGILFLSYKTIKIIAQIDIKKWIFVLLLGEYIMGA